MDYFCCHVYVYFDWHATAVNAEGKTEERNIFFKIHSVYLSDANSIHDNTRTFPIQLEFPVTVCVHETVGLMCVVMTAAHRTGSCLFSTGKNNHVRAYGQVTTITHTVGAASVYCIDLCVYHWTYMHKTWCNLCRCPTNHFRSNSTHLSSRR